VHADAGDGQEAGFDRPGGYGDVVHPHPGAELAHAVGALGELRTEVLRLVQVLRAGGVVGLVGDEQDLVAELQVQRPGARRRRHVRHWPRPSRVAHVDDAEAAGERVRDEGVAARQHDLQRIGPARDIAGRKQLHPAAEDRPGARHQANRMLTLLVWV